MASITSPVTSFDTLTSRQSPTDTGLFDNSGFTDPSEVLTQKSYPTILPISTLDVRHEWYDRYKDTFRQLDLLYKGDDDLAAQATEFLAARPHEPFDVYSSRVSMFCYFNYLRSIFSWYRSYLWERPPIIAFKTPTGTDVTSDDGYWMDFRDNVNRANLPIEDFFNDHVTLNMLLYHSAWVLIDSDPLPANPYSSRKSEIELGGSRPYLVAFDTRQVINWSEDKTGSLEWVMVKKTIIRQLPNDLSSFAWSTKPSTIHQWYIYDRQGWALYEYDLTTPANNPKLKGSNEECAALVDYGTHVLSYANRVPVHRIQVPFDLWLGNTVKQPVIRHLNLENQLASQIMQCALPVPVITGTKPGTSDNPSGSSPRTLGEYGAIELAEGGSFTWTEPAGTSMQIIAQQISAVIEEIHRIAHLQSQGRSSSNIPAVQSGIAKYYDSMPSIQVATSIGNILRRALVNVLKDVALARREEVIPTVTGLNFRESGLSETLDEEIRLEDLDWVYKLPLFIRIRAKAIVSRALANEPQDIQDKVLSSIDTLLTDDVITGLAEPPPNVLLNSAATDKTGFSSSVPKGKLPVAVKAGVKA